MLKILIFMFAFLMSASYAFADNYSLYIRRVDSNLYEDTRQDILIKTRMCLELSVGDNAVLIGHGGYGGELVFLDYDRKPKEKCDVESVYQKIKF